MAKDMYRQEVDPGLFLREDEEQQGLGMVGGTTSTLGPTRKGRRHMLKRLSGGKDLMRIVEMKAQIAAYWRDGESYAEIATQVSDEFGLEGTDRIGANGIHYHVKKMIATAREKATLHVNERMALILARYDQIEMLVTEAYFASMQTSTRNYQRQIKRAKSQDREKQLTADIKRERERLEVINKRRVEMKKAPLKGKLPDHVLGELPDILIDTAEHITELERVEDRPAGDPRFLAQLIDINDKRARLWHLLDKSDAGNPDQELAKLPDEERAQRMSAVLHSVMMRRTGDTGTLAPAGPLGGFQDGDLPVELQETPEEVDENNDIDWDFD